MSMLRCNPSVPVSIGKRRFNPCGKLYIVGRGLRSNPFFEKGRLSARIIVGFNVGDTPTYDLDDLMAITLETMRELKQPEGASFLAQKGRFGGPPGGPPVSEEGGQVIIIDFNDRSTSQFTNDITTLADVVRQKMGQYSVLVEIQDYGIPIISGEIRDREGTEEIVDIDEMLARRRLRRGR